MNKDEIKQIEKSAKSLYKSYIISYALIMFGVAFTLITLFSVGYLALIWLIKKG